MAEEAVSQFPNESSQKRHGKAMVLKVWVPRPTGAVVFPENLLGMQILWPYLRATESKVLEWA